MGNWGDMIPDLLIMIASRVHLFHDFLAFRGVCMLWRNVATKEYFVKKKHKQPPLLMLAVKHDDNITGVLSFYCPANKKIHSNVFYRELYNKICFETLGWLVIQDQIDMGLELFHPFSRVRIPLPDPSTFYSPRNCDFRSISKAVLSASPSFTQNYTLVVRYGHECQLALWRPGHQTWNSLRPRPTCFEDVLFYGDKLYAVNWDGTVFVVNFDLDGSEKVVMVCATAYTSMWSKNYLVESNGALCVLRTESVPQLNSEYHRKFEVFEVDLSRSGLKRVDDLGCIAFFVSSYSASSSVDTSIFPSIEPNCVYCAYDMTDKGDAMSIYNLADGKKEGSYKKQSHIISSSPMWATPSF